MPIKDIVDPTRVNCRNDKDEATFMKEITEVAPPIREIDLNDKQDPNKTLSSTDVVLVKATFFPAASDKAEPTFVIARSDKVDPNATKFNTDAIEPSLIPERNEMEEPNFSQSITEMWYDEPIRSAP
jgi:hypothetical protein